VADGLVAAARKRKTVLALTVLVAAVSIWGLSKVIVDNAVVEYFRGKTDISLSDAFMRKFFGGSKDISLVVEADTTDRVLSPQVLGAVSDFESFFTQNEPLVGKAVGFVDVIKRVNQVFNVDESPDGIKVKEVEKEGVGSGQKEVGKDTGAEASNGFGDFGNFGAAAPPAASAQPPVTSASPKFSINTYTAADILRLLDNAAAQKGGMDAEELVREIRRLTNLDGYAYYEVPRVPARYGKTTDAQLEQLIASYLVLVSGGDFSSYSNDPTQPTAIRTMLQLRATGDTEIKRVMGEMNDYVEANFTKYGFPVAIGADKAIPKGGIRVIIGVNAAVESAVTALVVTSQIISIIVSIVMVLIILAASYRSLAAGLIAAIPLAIAIMVNFAVMGFTGTKLNICTALIASVSVGIGIDYTIHFIDTFKREFAEAAREGRDNYLRKTFESSGKAIIINAVSVGMGFGVLTFSRFRILGQFGSLILLSMFVSALVSLTVIPVLLAMLRPKFIYGRGV
jgi:predicted RND superfamily exporter protein